MFVFQLFQFRFLKIQLHYKDERRILIKSVDKSFNSIFPYNIVGFIIYSIFLLFFCFCLKPPEFIVKSRFHKNCLEVLQNTLIQFWVNLYMQYIYRNIALHNVICTICISIYCFLSVQPLSIILYRWRNQHVYILLFWIFWKIFLEKLQMN